MSIVCNFCFKVPPPSKAIIQAEGCRAHICEDCIAKSLPIVEKWRAENDE